jgi:hypothetical protein
LLTRVDLPEANTPVIETNLPNRKLLEFRLKNGHS